jgi:hypothetical protein
VLSYNLVSAQKYRFSEPIGVLKGTQHRSRQVHVPWQSDSRFSNETQAGMRVSRVEVRSGLVYDVRLLTRGDVVLNSEPSVGSE